jgi:CHAT domain-containing protein/tetratricopeptide (TPR) repeat protein
MTTRVMAASPGPCAPGSGVTILQDISRGFNTPGRAEDVILVEAGPAPAYTCAMARPLVFLAALLLLSAGRLDADTAADADALFQRAAAEYQTGRPDSSIRLLGQALSLYEKAGLKGRQIEVLNWIGLIEYYRASYDAADARFQDALTRSRAAGLAALAAATLNNQGLVRYAQARYAEAVRMYTAALEEHIRGGDTAAAAQTLGNIASVFLAWARYPEAEKAYKDALAAFQELGDGPSTANTHLNLGLLYSGWARYQASRAELEEGLAMADSMGLRQSSAYGLAGLGSVYFATGRYELAEKTYQRALELDTDLGLALNAVSVTLSLGKVYQAWGRPDQARALYSQALAEAEKLGVPDQAMSAVYLVGTTLQDEGRYPAAMEQFQAAMALADKIGIEAARLPMLEALGSSSFLSRKTADARAWYRAAYELALRLDKRDMAARQLVHLGAVNQVAGLRTEALDNYTRALEMFRAIGLKAEEATALNDLGTLHLDMGSYDTAAQELLQAIAVKEELRRTAAGQARMDYLASQLSSYRWLVTARILAGDPAGAFQASELMKARWLAEELGAGREQPGDQPAGVQAAQAVMDPRALMVSYACMDAERPAVIAVSRDAIQARELSTAAAPAAAGREDAGDEAAPTRGFIITRASRTHTGIADRVEAYRRLLVLARPTAGQRQERMRLGRELYDILLGPVAGMLDGKDELLLIPEGSLCALPLETLVLPDGRYLVERFHVTYVPSLAVKRLLESRRADAPAGGPGAAPPASPAPRPLLAVGGALYSARERPASRSAPRISAQQLASLRVTAEDLAAENRGIGEIYTALGLDAWEDLPGTRAEVAAISALYPGARTLTGAEASEDTLKGMSRNGTLGRFGVVHLATHGIAVPQAPDLSALVLSLGAGGGSEDGYLTMREIAALELQADFVNLSACETGMGRILAGEGVVGLSEAFLRAGTASLSVSLWPVSDEGTRAFMTELYKGVTEKKLSFARAMTMVKRSFLSAGAFREPFYWAPFVFYGS